MDKQNLGLLLIAVGATEFPLIMLIAMRNPRANKATFFLAALVSSTMTCLIGTLFMLGKI